MSDDVKKYRKEVKMEKLAIKGGYPVRSSKLYYGRQWIVEEDISAVEDVLRSDFLTCGPKVDELERTLADYTGAKYAVAVNSGMNLHFKVLTNGNSHHLAEAMFKSFAKALDQALSRDERITDVLSTKGSL